MSRNLAEHRLERTFTNTLNGLARRQTQVRSLQPQGSESLRVESIVGYMYLPIPTGATTPAYNFIDIESDNPDDIMIATLASSTFMKYDDGTFLNADLENDGLGDDTWSIFLAYDNRDIPSYITMTESPTATLGDRLAGVLDDYSIAHHRARIVICVQRLTTTAPPAALDQYLFIYEIRAIIG